MNDLQIKYFLSVSETQNISESARQLFVSTPAISRQILMLEEELGFPLFSRTNHGVELLPDGLKFRELLLSTESKILTLKENAKQRREAVSRPLHLGLPIDWMPIKLIQALNRAVNTVSPGAGMTVSGIEMTELDAALADGVIDMSVYPALSSSESRKNKWQYLCPLRRAVIYGKENPAAKKAAGLDREPTLAELASTPLILTEERILSYISAFCISHGINPQYVFTGTMLSVLQTVGAGVGFCITDEWCIASGHSSFGCIYMPDTTHASLIWNPENTYPRHDEIVNLLLTERLNWAYE